MRKGIILAGGKGTRLFPLTKAISKQLLPVYDKPMIYYPLTVLMLAGLRDILVIHTPEDGNAFKKLLGDGSQWGVNIEYAIQNEANGIAQAYIIAEDYLDGASSTLVLGDNIFFGQGISSLLISANNNQSGATIFGYNVSNPEQYGVLEFDEHRKVTGLIEKPKRPPSNYAITGLYFADNTASERAKDIRPSLRGELEITDLLESYMRDRNLQVDFFGRGFCWFDTGTQKSLLEASNFVQTLTERQGLQVGSPDEVAYRTGFIGREELIKLVDEYGSSNYGSYLRGIISNENKSSNA